ATSLSCGYGGAVGNGEQRQNQGRDPRLVVSYVYDADLTDAYARAPIPAPVDPALHAGVASGLTPWPPGPLASGPRARQPPRPASSASATVAWSRRAPRAPTPARRPCTPDGAIPARRQRGSA